MSWVALFFAGIFEVTWVVFLKLSNGFTKTFESIMTICTSLIGFYLLGVASKEIDMQVAYSIWVGIGAIGIFLVDVFYFNSKYNMSQILFLILIVIGIIGIKMFSK